MVPRGASASWRTWLMTGMRTEPIARRRVRGDHKGLKRMLVEGMGDGGEGPRPWKSFSGAMVRQAVEEAVSSLPPRQKQLIKLAYFSDLSNREIAQGMGITLTSVERGLRQAVARVSDHVERGRAAGRRAIYALAMFLGGRWLSAAHQAVSVSAQQWVKAGALAVVSATAGAVLASQTASPAQLNHVAPGTLPAIASSQPYAVVQNHVVDIPQANNHVVDIPQATNHVVEHVMATAAAAGGVKVAGPPVALPAVKLPISVKLPHRPPLPLVHGLLGA
ncbi:MAG: sigma factor-like helix-turn-helix DNA-binding protein [Candidatus Dormibacteraceae bacterium]